MYRLKLVSFALFIIFLVQENVNAQITGLSTVIVPRQSLLFSDVTVFGSLGFNRHIGDFQSAHGHFVWNTGRKNFMAGGGLLIPSSKEVQTSFTFGGTFGYDIQPVSDFPWKPEIKLQTGLGYTKIRDKGLGNLIYWDIPVILGFGWVLPPPKANIKAWIAAKSQVRFLDDFSFNSDELRVGIGLALGLGILPARSKSLGAQASVEALFIEDDYPASTIWQLTFNVAFSWNAYMSKPRLTTNK